MTTVSELQNVLSSLVAGKGFELDNRTIQENLEFIQQYTQLVPYKPITGSEESDATWADIFFIADSSPQSLSAIYQDSALARGELWPQQALLLAFLKMLETPRALLNYFPYAHRELYYRKLLGLSERAVEPARVALSFQLNSKLTELLIPADTLFSAGQDRQGTPIQYALEKALLANQSHWTDLRWCWRPEGEGTPAESYIGYDEAQKQSWPAAGRRLFSASDRDQDILTGRLLASAALERPEAKKFTLILSDYIESTRVNVSLVSSGDHWIKLLNTTPGGLVDSLEFEVPEDAGPIIAPTDLDGITLGLPVLKIGCEDQTPLPDIVELKVDADEETTNFDEYVLTPFGYSEEEQPVVGAQLYLGFSGIQPGQTLSLYWELQGAKSLNLDWEYLNEANRWGALDASVIDETQGLFRSGLWSAILPADASQTAPSMPSGRYWLRALMANSSALPSEASDYPLMVGLLTNGMTAVMLDVTALDADSLSQPLPADTISQPVFNIAGLSSTQQPWPSWGGRPQETSEAFFEGAAQRLAHRHRALTWQDMVVILKTQFSAVFDVAIPARVKQTMIPAIREQWLVVIPLNTQKDNADPLRPLLNEAALDSMASYLQRLASPWQNIMVKNPTYRDVNIQYVLSFHPGVNPDYGYRQVQQALEQHYMPWSNDQPGGVKLASCLDYYDVIAQIQQQAVVDHVVELTLDDKKDSIEGKDDEVLVLVWGTSSVLNLQRSVGDE